MTQTSQYTKDLHAPPRIVLACTAAAALAVVPAGAASATLKVPEGKTAKNRLHLDLKVSGGRAQPVDLRTERTRATVSRLVEAGGSVLSDFDAHGSLDHVTMADPEGNEFCVV